MKTVIDATDLINRIKEQVEGLDVEIKINEIKEVKKVKDYFVLYTNKEEFSTKSIIIAMGLQPRRLGIPGETEFAGRGISYCANCDGPFFKNKVVVVVGGGNSALDASEVLSKIASQVHLIHRREEFRAFDALAKEVKERPNIKIHTNCEVKKISGENKVENISIYNGKENKTYKIPTDGVFIEIGRIANTDLFASFVERDERDQIIIDKDCQTKARGIFAAGDVTQIEYKQIPIACGQATIAALATYKYLQYTRGKKDAVVYDRSLKKQAK